MLVRGGGADAGSEPEAARYVSIRETFAEVLTEMVDYRTTPTKLTLWDNDVLTGALPQAKKGTRQSHRTP